MVVNSDMNKVEQSYFHSNKRLNGLPTLGERNNNPLNIRKNSANNWQGKVDSDNAFEKFTSTVFGIRAGLIILRNYRKTYGLNTLAQIIERFSPTVGSVDGKEYFNNTSNYILFVAGKSGIGAFQSFDFTPDNLLPIVQSMAFFESGYVLSASEFSSAWMLAFPVGTGLN